MKLFQFNKYYFEQLGKTDLHYQFLISKGKSLLHLMYENDSPCPYTGIHIWISLLDPNCLFSVDLSFKGYSVSFHLLSNYWED